MLDLPAHAFVFSVFILQYIIPLRFVEVSSVLLMAFEISRKGAVHKRRLMI